MLRANLKKNNKKREKEKKSFLTDDARLIGKLLIALKRKGWGLEMEKEVEGWRSWGNAIGRRNDQQQITIYKA